MKFNPRSRLEVIEFVVLFLVGLGAVITIASGSLSYLIFPLILALILNYINRRHREQRLYAKTREQEEKLETQLWKELDFLQQEIQRQQETLTQLSQRTKPQIQLTAPPGDTNPANGSRQTEIESYQDYLVSLEESLNHVIQYLNHAGINQRFQRLEDGYEQLSEALVHLRQKVTAFQNVEGEQGKTIKEPPVLLVSSKDKHRQVEETSASSTPVATSAPAPALQPQWVKRHQISGHENGVTDLMITKDNYCVATVSLDQNLKLWSLQTGELLLSTLAHEKGILAIAGQQVTSEVEDSFQYQLATGGFDYNIKLWNFTTNQAESFKLISTHTLNGHLGSIRSLAMTPNGKFLISGSYDRTIKQWQLEDGVLIQSSYDDLTAIQGIAISYDSQIIVSGDEEGQIYFWEVKTGIKRGALSGNESSVKSLALSNNGQYLVAGCSDGSVKLWTMQASIFRDGETPTPTKVLTGHQGEIQAVLFSPCSQYLMSGDIYGLIQIWSMTADEPITSLALATNTEAESETTQNRLLSLALSDDGQFLVAGDVQGNLTIWELEQESSSSSEANSETEELLPEEANGEEEE